MVKIETTNNNKEYYKVELHDRCRRQIDSGDESRTCTMAGSALTVDETVHQNVRYASNGTYSSAPLFINKSKFAVDLE